MPKHQGGLARARATGRSQAQRRSRCQPAKRGRRGGAVREEPQSDARLRHGWTGGHGGREAREARDRLFGVLIIEPAGRVRAADGRRVWRYENIDIDATRFGGTWLNV